jgi:hypothetical protein
MTKSVMIVLTGAVLGLAVVGCSRVRPPVQGRLDPYAPPQVTFADSAMKDRTAVGTPILTRDEGGLLHVTVPFRSAEERQIYIDYRITFVDRNGQVLSQSAWMPKVLTPNVPDQIQANSMSPQAADFQLDLRYAK